MAMLVKELKAILKGVPDGSPLLDKPVTVTYWDERGNDHCVDATEVLVDEHGVDVRAKW